MTKNGQKRTVTNMAIATGTAESVGSNYYLYKLELWYAIIHDVLQIHCKKYVTFEYNM